MSRFDYQSIIEACGIQNVNLQKAFAERSDEAIKFQEQFNIFKKLNEEKERKSETLSRLKLELDNNLQKLDTKHKKFSALSKELKTVQDEISQLNAEFQNKSNDFGKKIADLDNEVRELYSQFEGETLTNLLTDVNTELLAIQDTEAQLQRKYEQLRLANNSESEYERPTALKAFTEDMLVYKELKELENELAKKRRNIEIISAEYNKKMEMLQKLS